MVNTDTGLSMEHSICFHLNKLCQEVKLAQLKGIVVDLFQIFIYCFMLFLFFLSMSAVFEFLVMMIQMSHNNHLLLDGHNVYAKWNSSEKEGFSSSNSSTTSSRHLYKESRFLGESVELYCNIETKYDTAANQRPAFLWLHDGKEVMATDRCKVSLNVELDEKNGEQIYKVESQLRISNLSKSDFGQYSCFLKISEEEKGCEIISECDRERHFNLANLVPSYWRISAPVGATLEIRDLDFITRLESHEWRNTEIILQKNGKNVLNQYHSMFPLSAFGGCYPSSLFHFAKNHQHEIPEIYRDSACPYSVLMPFMNYAEPTRQQYTPDYKLQNINNRTHLTRLGVVARLCVGPQSYGVITVTFRQTDPKSRQNRDFVHPVKILLVPPETAGFSAYEKFVQGEINRNRTAGNYTSDNVTEQLQFIVMQEKLKCEWVLRSLTEYLSLGLVTLTLVLTIPYMANNIRCKMENIYNKLSTQFLNDTASRSMTAHVCTHTDSSKKQVYLAYDHNDISRAKEIVGVLEEHVENVYFHIRDNTPGRPEIKIKSEKIEDCKKWIILLSSSYSLDQIEPMMIFTKAERTSTFHYENVMIIQDGSNVDIPECFREVYDYMAVSSGGLGSFQRTWLKDWAAPKSFLEDFNLILRPCAVWSALIIAFVQFWLAVFFVVVIASLLFHFLLSMLYVHPAVEFGDCHVFYSYIKMWFK